MITEKNKDGIVFLNKPLGETSFRSLGCIKKTLGIRKVGHTGTLDKFAEGLLIVLTGRFTKLNSLITGMDKVYEAEFCFGKETDTLDPEGKIVGEAPLPSESLIREKISLFVGDILQRPPIYSAIHINGQRAHKLARKGIEHEMPARPVTIYAFDLLAYEEGILKVRVHCSKGTYIRSLARDLGLACNSRAYVSALKRTKVGPFLLENSLTPDRFRETAGFYPWTDFLKALPDTGICEVREEARTLIGNGVPFRVEFLKNPIEPLAGMTALTDNKGIVLALLVKDEGCFRYRINFS
ncbi:MAG: tRNA pseudouridine(55) synthase TruB [Spirochaetaceae bacterium 4572_59]|nr:MAG: tRNA pseudouridine(55) synthase TruB [Spirochaetaceae bacterium 4572_59]